MLSSKQAGKKVVFTCEDGDTSTKEFAKKFLKVGETYTIKHIRLGSWSTSVLLEEFSKMYFNSVLFSGIDLNLEYKDWGWAYED